MYYIGVDIGGTNVKLGVISDSAEIVKRLQRPFSGAPERVADDIAAMAREALAQYPGARMGVACAGAITDSSVDASNLGWRDVPLGELLEARLGGEAPLVNDARAAMLGERRFGELKGVEHGLYLTIGTGVGGGIIADGKIYSGSGGYGGEFGHMITHAGGPRCSCGQHGCYELYASATALRRMSGLPAREAIDRARRGELADVWREYIDEVLTGLAGLMCVFSPDVIALGGGVSNAGDFLTDSLMERIAKTPGYGYGRLRSRVRLGRFRGDAGLVGAASLAMPDSVFT